MNDARLSPRLLLLTSLCLVLAACGGTAPGASTSPTPTGGPSGQPGPTGTPGNGTMPPPGTFPVPTPMPSPGTFEVTSAAQAAALVFASQPRFSSIAPLQPDLVGQSAWYEATDVGDHFEVTVTLGSGDCMAGCIDRHTWHYTVQRDGAIALVAEEGDEVEGPVGNGSGDPATIDVLLSAGPICPVVQDPPDPSCADRPVANVEVTLRDPTGGVVATAVSDEQGRVRFTVPAGAYYVEAAAVEGLMVQAQAAAVAVRGADSAHVTLGYDTGIR